MAGVISFRTTKKERELLHLWARERGHKTISEFIRAQLGFQIGIEGTESMQEADEITTFTQVAKVLAQLCDRMDEMRRQLNMQPRAPIMPPAKMTAEEKANLEQAGFQR